MQTLHMFFVTNWNGGIRVLLKRRITGVLISGPEMWLRPQNLETGFVSTRGKDLESSRVVGHVWGFDNFLLSV